MYLPPKERRVALHGESFNFAIDSMHLAALEQLKK